MGHISDKRKAYIEKTRDRIRALARIWRQKNAKMMKEYQQKYFQEHKSYFRDYYREYYRTHKELIKKRYLKNRNKIIARVRKYQQEHVEELKATRRLRKLRTGRW